jgi:hypothetical protein
VIDTEHHDLTLDLVDPIHDAVRAASSRMDAGHLSAKRLPDSMRILDEGAGQARDDRRSNALG